MKDDLLTELIRSTEDVLSHWILREQKNRCPAFDKRVERVWQMIDRIVPREPLGDTEELGTIVQKNGHNCGPVAVFNACVLLGKKPPTLKKLKEVMKTDKDGTSESGVKRGIKLAGLIISEVPTEITILGYMEGKYGHYTVVKNTPPRKFYVYNWSHTLISSFKTSMKRAEVSKEWFKRACLSPDSEVYYVKLAE